ncbi:SDR family oxidoreductase [Leifsonia sp. 2MCAF36]|uniref:SDR family oxidoreductase n=1 Tax=Leifsonia sp. 2MCAF36 TaxID=3232988 RepID=UPI003F9E974D
MSRVAIIGAHGKVAQQLMRVLYDLGDDFVGIVRNDEHADDVYRLGGEGVLLDVEKSEPEALAAAIAGCDAVVFTAGAGAGSGIERKRTVDYGGSVKAQKAAALAGIRRFVQVSAWGADAPVDGSDPVWTAYIEAKRDADAALRDSGLEWTILRPGGLTTEEGTGRITLGDSVPRGSIAREDVARLIALTLHEPATAGHQWEVISGESSIEDAVRALVASA